MTLPDAHEIEGDSVENVVDAEIPDRMDKAPSCNGDISNGDHLDPDQPNYDNEGYQEQTDHDPSNHCADNGDNQSVKQTAEIYVNHVERISQHFNLSKPASYYGDGWEEESPPPLDTRLQERQRVVPPVAPPAISPVVPPTTYPHISEIIPHWTQFADPHANKDVPFCKQLAKGGCSQSDECRFRHSLTIEEYTLLFNDHQPNLWTLQRDGFNWATTSSPAIARPQAVDLLPQSWPSNAVAGSTFSQECKFYPIGKCRNGDLCPFQHTQHPLAPGTTVSNPEQDWKTSERPAFGPQDSGQRQCKYYAERGYCSRGLLCKFPHSGHPDHPSSGPSGPESAPSVDDDKGWSTGWEEGNKVNNNNSDADTPAEDNGWGAATWEEFPKQDDYSVWDPSGNNDSYKPRPQNSNVCFKFAKGLCNRGNACKFSHDQGLSNNQSSEAPKIDDGGWPPMDDSSHSVPWNTAPPAPCPYFLKGNCRNGAFCHMSHDFEEKVQEESRPEKSYSMDNPSGEINQNKAQSTEREPKTMNENPPEVQEDSRNSHILDNEATWSQPWPTETVQPPSFSPKVDAPCMRFGQGYCPFGDDCTYLHIIEDADSAEYTSNSEENVPVSISLNKQMRSSNLIHQ